MKGYREAQLMLAHDNASLHTILQLLQESWSQNNWREKSVIKQAFVWVLQTLKVKHTHTHTHGLSNFIETPGLYIHTYTRPLHRYNTKDLKIPHVSGHVTEFLPPIHVASSCEWSCDRVPSSYTCSILM